MCRSKTSKRRMPSALRRRTSCCTRSTTSCSRICAYTASSGSGTGGRGFGGCCARHRVQGLGNLGGDVGENGLHRRREESGGGILVFGRRVFDDEQANALQRRVQVAQRQHHCRAGALAAQESRLARRAENEGVERIVQRLAKLDAEIGGGAMEDFAARVIQRDRAITRVRKGLLQGWQPSPARLQ